MSSRDENFYDALVNGIREISRLMRGIVELSTSNPSQGICSIGVWNSVQARNNLFLSHAQQFRNVAGELARQIEGAQVNKSLRVHTCMLSNEPNDTLMRYLQRNFPRVFLLVEETVADSVAHMQNQANTAGKLQAKLNEMTKLCQNLLERADFLRIIIGRREETPLFVETRTQRSFSSDAPSIENVLGAFDDALSEVKSQPRTQSTGMSPSSGPDQQRTRDLTHEDVAIQAKVAEVNQAYNRIISTPNRGVPRGRGGNGGPIRGSPPAHLQATRSQPHITRQGQSEFMPGVNAGGTSPLRNDHGRTRTMLGGARAPDGHGPAPPRQSTREEFARTIKELQDITPRVKNITLNSFTDDIEGCEIATQFVPTAKQLLSKLNSLTQHMDELQISKQDQIQIRKLGLDFIHMTKEMFLQQHTDSERLELDKCTAVFMNGIEDVRAGRPLASAAASVGAVYSSAPQRGRPSPGQHSSGPGPGQAQPRNQMPPQSGGRDTQRAGTLSRPSQPPPSIPDSRGAAKSMPPAPTQDAPPPPMKTISKEDSRRHAVEEIFESEKSYLKTLQKIIWLYKKPLQENAASNDAVLSMKEVQDLFSNIESMFLFNKNLLKELQKTKSDPSMSIGSVFVSVAPMMKIYCSYINNYDVSAQTLLDCQNRPSFNAFLEQINMVAGVDMKLSAFLIQPVQRLPRYEMLVSAVCKYTDENHPEYHELMLAKQKIKEINDEVNESKRKAEARDAVFQVQMKMSEKPPDLIILEPTRVLKLEGAIQRENPKTKKPEKRYVHIFSDLVIVSRLKGSSAAQGFKYRDHFTLDDKITCSYDTETACVQIVNCGSLRMPPGVLATPENMSRTISETWIMDSADEAKTWAMTIRELIIARSARSSFSR